MSDCLPFGSEAIMPDETIFGYLFRMERRFPKRCFNSQLGCITNTNHWLFPSQLAIASLISKTSIRTLIKKNTCVPLFKISLSKAEYKVLTNKIIANENVGNIMQISRIPASHVKLSSQIKYCTKCAVRDINRVGFAYWRCKHQLPGVSVCYKHRWMLNALPWSTSTYEIDAVLKAHYAQSPPHPNAIHYAIFSSQILQIARSKSLTGCIQSRFKRKLCEKGLMTSSNRVNRVTTQEKLSEYVANLGVVGNLNLNTICSSLIHHKQHFPSHPFKRLLLASFLYPTGSNFWLKKAAKPVVPNKTFLTIDNDEEKVISMIKRGMSINFVAKTIQRSRCFVKRVARQKNLIPGIEAHIGTKAFQQALFMLKLGLFVQEVSARANISFSQTERIISETEGLAAIRKNIWKLERQASHKTDLIDYIHSNTALRTEIKQACYKQYYWLFSNNRAWIEDKLPPPSRPVPPNVKNIS